MMRAKMEVRRVSKWPGREELELACVCGKEPFGPDGESEDNTFARWTPTGGAHMTITNPALLGRLAVGQKFYVDFTEAPE
ncbi:MAG: hypothetical protein ACYC0B_02275 [Gemmatimonadaceae bacterium]